MYILWYESLGEESDIRATLARHHQIYRRDVARWIQQGIAEGDMSDSVDPQRFAAVYCATMFGSIYQWVVSSDSLDIDSFFDYLEKMMIFYVQTAR